MEHIAAIFNSINHNGFAVGIIVFIIIAGIYLLKRGYLSINKGSIKLGAGDLERRIIQRQTTFVHGQIDSIGNKLCLDHSDFDRYKTLWICKCVEIEWIRSIHYNHVEDSDGYKDDRFIAIRDIVQKKASNPYFFSTGFEDIIKKHVDEVVKQLVKIRRRGEI